MEDEIEPCEDPPNDAIVASPAVEHPMYQWAEGHSPLRACTLCIQQHFAAKMEIDKTKFVLSIGRARGTAMSTGNGRRYFSPQQ